MVFHDIEKKASQNLTCFAASFFNAVDSCLEVFIPKSVHRITCEVKGSISHAPNSSAANYKFVVIVTLKENSNKVVNRIIHI